MEYKRNNNYRERSRVTVPERGGGKVSPSAPFATPASKIRIPTDLAHERQTLGFDDIPMEDDNLEHVRFRDIFRAWAKQAVKDSPIEKRLKDAQKKTGRLNDIKNDLKWALQADLDEPVKPSRKIDAKPRPADHAAKDHAQIAAPTPRPVAETSKTIDININLGSLPKLPRFSKVTTSIRELLAKLRHFRWSRRRIAIAAAVLLVIVCSVLVWRVVPGINGSKKNTGATASTDTVKTPDYKTALPEGKSIESLGGWHRVSPPDRSPVFAYADKIGDVPINVSQQPIPDSFKPNIEDSVAELAKNYSATDKVSAGSLTLYVGTSTEGPQSAILEKDGLLILMKSTKKISDDAWAGYVQSLTK